MRIACDRYNLCTFFLDVLVIRILNKRHKKFLCYFKDCIDYVSESAVRMRVIKFEHTKVTLGIDCIIYLEMRRKLQK